MKTVLITVDDIGKSVFGFAPCTEAFDSCDFGGGRSAENSFLGQLQALDIHNGSTVVRRVSVIADAESSESCELVGRVIRTLAERLPPNSVYAYFVGRDLPSGYTGRSGLLGSFRKTYLVNKDERAGNVAKLASDVMLLHEIREVAPLMEGRSLGSLVRAYAWPVSTLKALEPSQGEEFARMRLLQGVLPDALQAVDLLIDDLRRRLGSVLEILPTFDRWEERTYQALVKPIEQLIMNLADESAVLKWDTLLECLPHSLDVQTRLALAFREVSDPVERRKLADAVTGSVRQLLELSRQMDCQPADLPAEIVKGIVAVRLEDRDRPAIFREKVEGNCRHLLRALESPAIRRRMLEALICFALRERKVEFGDLGPVRDELRRHFYQARGRYIYLILPKDSMAERERNELRAWIEQVMGSPCENVLTERNEAWLYIETPYDGGADLLGLHHTVSQVHERGDVRSPTPSAAAVPGPADIRPLSLSSASDSSAQINGPCPDCGAPQSEPSLAVRPSGDGPSHHQNGSRPRKTCPTCGRLNTKDWWVCWNHGKAPVLVAIDKARCPDCILRHHENPEAFPLSDISVNPHYKEPIHCPNCLNLRCQDPGHPIFQIPDELEKYYRDGVNGHDSVRFREAVRRAGLFGDCYCPNCGTILIPVHHKAGTSLPS